MWISFFVAFCVSSTLLMEESTQIRPNHQQADFVELTSLDPTIKLDIRYAQSNNFIGYPVYPESRAFLQRPAAEALLRVHKKLKEKRLGLVIFDGYRPWHITKLFWESVPKNQRKFVANPRTGSKHNRGCAVDLSVYDLQTGIPLAMPSAYDEFTNRAAINYQGGSKQERAHRDMLQTLMKMEGFFANPKEWWHFDYKDWRDYPLYDFSFVEIDNLDKKFPVAKVVE